MLGAYDRTGPVALELAAFALADAGLAEATATSVLQGVAGTGGDVAVTAALPYAPPADRAGTYLRTLAGLGFDPLTAGRDAAHLAGDNLTPAAYARLLYTAYPQIAAVTLLQAVVARGSGVQSAAAALSQSGLAPAPADLARALKALFPSPVTAGGFAAALGGQSLEAAMTAAVGTYALDATQAALLVVQQVPLATAVTVARALRFAGLAPQEIAAALTTTMPWLSAAQAAALSTGGD